MTINNITMTSSNTTRIYLPCDLTDDLSMEAIKTVWEHGKDGRDIKTIAAYLVPHVSRTRPTIGYVVEITTNDGQKITQRIYGSTTSQTAADILDSFFAAGAPGLDAEYRKCYEQQHNEYRNRYRRCAA